MKENNLKLSAPWYKYRNELAALFELDEQVSVSAIENQDGGGTVTVSVFNHEKAVALFKILKDKLDFGSYSLRVKVEDTSGEETEADVLRAAFAYNRRVRGVRTVEDATGTEWCYLVMEPDVIQFFNDNLADYRRNTTILSADAAADVLALNVTRVCTADLTEN